MIYHGHLFIKLNICQTIRKLSWKTITTRGQKKRQEKAENLNQDEKQEKLNENFSSKPFGIIS